LLNFFLAHQEDKKKWHLISLAALPLNLKIKFTALLAVSTQHQGKAAMLPLALIQWLGNTTRTSNLLQLLRAGFRLTCLALTPIRALASTYTDSFSKKLVEFCFVGSLSLP
jgi:hypothetical protein